MAAAPMTPLETFRAAVLQAFREAPLATNGCNPPVTLEIFVPAMSAEALHALSGAQAALRGSIEMRYQLIADMGRPVGYATTLHGRAASVRDLMAAWHETVLDEMVRTAWRPADVAAARGFGEGVDLTHLYDPGPGLG